MNKSISIVVPALNEEALLEISIKNLEDILKDGFDYEILLFDDGSQEGKLIESRSPSVKFAKPEIEGLTSFSAEYTPSLKTGWVYMVDVDPAYRGKGVGFADVFGLDLRRVPP